MRMRFAYCMQQRENARDLRLQLGAKTKTSNERPDACYGAKISLQIAARQWRSSDDTSGD
ncbi:MAG TPA: hypothetical protein VHX44_01085 [Planctomycetota bacterium]|nr:hypothetical protein [Planctomycetota bacterium]